MKQSKVVQDTVAIIHSDLSVSQKLSALAEMKFEGRPGRADAEKIRDSYLHLPVFIVNLTNKGELSLKLRLK